MTAGRPTRQICYSPPTTSWYCDRLRLPRFAGLRGQEKGLLFPLGEVAVIVRLPQQTSTDYQPGPAQQFSYTLRLAVPEGEGDRVTQRLCQVQRLVTGLGRQ